MRKTEYPRSVMEYDSFSEDFDGGDLSPQKIDKSYKYIRKNIFYRIFAKFLYRGLATPAAFVYTRLSMREKYHGKQKLKKCGGCFLYGNHTQPIADAFSPNMVAFPKKCYIIISPKNFSLPIIGRALPELGGIPIPTEFSAMRNFISAVKTRANEGAAVVIYPEAHLWPFCSFLRPFDESSFDFPLKCGLPAFSFTRVYKKRGKRGFKCDIYIDGPFYPEEGLNPKEARADLAGKLRRAMEERLALSDVVIVDYVPRKREAEHIE